jgi:hypothetical protein
MGGASGIAKSHGDRKQIEEAARLQVFLDNSNFGPGKIDGITVNLRERRSCFSNVHKGKVIQ